MVRSKKKTEALDDVFEDLSGANRRRRQEASHVVATLAHKSPDLLLQHINSLVDALYRPEAQTRWEILNALSVLVPIDANTVADAFDGAEASLFDDTSGKVRLAAFQFLAIYGSTSESRSNKAWLLLDEAIQCYHGDIEYHSMLAALTTFASGTISKKVSAALAKRMGFDAKHGFGYVQSMSAKIIDILQSSRASSSSTKKSSSRSSQSSNKNKATKGEETTEQSQKEKAAEAKASSKQAAPSKEPDTEGVVQDKKPSQKDDVKSAKSAGKKAKPVAKAKPAKSTGKKTASAKPATAVKKASTANSVAKETTAGKNVGSAKAKKASAVKSNPKNSVPKKQPVKRAATKKSRRAVQVAE